MANVMEYKCPRCNGILEFDSQLQKMKCPYCDSIFTVEEIQHKDDVLEQKPKQPVIQKPHARPGQQTAQTQTAQEPQDDMSGMGVYTCNSCGGELVADENTAATHCPFCGNPVMLTGRLSGALRPDLVIPFQKTKEDAKQALRDFTAGKKLLPKLFKSENHIDEVKGVYVPFWLYDAQADAQMRFEGVQTRTWRAGQYQYTERRYFDVERAGSLLFDNVPVDGSAKMPADLMESLEPYDIGLAQPFQTAYLSGYLADKYDVSSDDSAERADERIRKSAQDAIASTVTGYDGLNPLGGDVQIHRAKPKYALYPVWMLTTTYQNKQYRFAMNGQTGKFVGTLPVDKKSLWLYRLLYTGIIGAVVWLVLHFLFGF